MTERDERSKARPAKHSQQDETPRHSPAIA
jgi:hypothetical protein